MRTIPWDEVEAFAMDRAGPDTEVAGAATEGTAPDRPAYDGPPWCWGLRYHDLMPLTGEAGIAATWNDMDGPYAAILREKPDARGSVGEGRRYDGAIDLGEALRTPSVPGTGVDGEWGEDVAFRSVVPVTSDGWRVSGARDAKALLTLPERRHLAREAVSAATLAPAMRETLHAILDHGLPRDARTPMIGLRGRLGAGLWDVLGFAVAHPGLAYYLFNGPPRPHLSAGMGAAEAIRVDLPGLTNAHLARFAGPGRLCAGTMGRPEVRRFSSVLLVASCLPSDLIPREEGWAEFVTLCMVAERFCRDTDLDPGAMLRAAKGDWVGYATRASALAEGEMDAPWVLRPMHETGWWTRPLPPGASHERKRSALCVKAAAARDPVVAMSESLVLPLMGHRAWEGGPAGDVPTKARAEALRAATALLYGGKSLLRALDVSREWHAVASAMDSRIRSAGDAIAWVPLFQGPLTFGEVEARCVSDALSLREEGAPTPDREGHPGLSHCIVSRLPVLLRGRSHVLSLRHAGTGRRLSTVQVSLAREAVGKVRLSVVEHRGMANAAAPPEADDAVSALVAALEAGDWSPPTVMGHVGPDGACLHDLGVGCGYDWRDLDAIRVAIGVWGPFLPRWARGLDPGALVDAMVAQGVLRADWEAALAVPA